MSIHSEARYMAVVPIETMKIVVQNLAKTAGLGSRLVREYDPDVLLVQEIASKNETESFELHVSRLGYGTGIHAKDKLFNVRRVESPYAEMGGIIRKKTIVATLINGVEVVSFHGYNGQPWKSIEKSCAHVRAVLEVLSSDGPALFAGDFNTWSEEHLAAVSAILQWHGFDLAFSCPYPGRATPLDHVFVRKIVFSKNPTSFANESDHRGAVFDIVVPK